MKLRRRPRRQMEKNLPPLWRKKVAKAKTVEESRPFYPWQRELFNAMGVCIAVRRGPPPSPFTSDDLIWNRVTIYMDHKNQGKTGKTTAIKHILEYYPNTLYLNVGEENSFLREEVRRFPGDLDVVIIEVPKGQHDRVDYGLIEQLQDGTIGQNPVKVVMFTKAGCNVDIIGEKKWDLVVLIPNPEKSTVDRQFFTAKDPNNQEK